MSIELNEELLARAKVALGTKTARATMEEALRRAIEQAKDERARRREVQLEYLGCLPDRVDLDVLALEPIWR
jgi:Arc/MetJ family transcription regulator